MQQALTRLEIPGMQKTLIHLEIPGMQNTLAHPEIPEMPRTDTNPRTQSHPEKNKHRETLIVPEIRPYRRIHQKTRRKSNRKIIFREVPSSAALQQRPLQVQLPKAPATAAETTARAARTAPTRKHHSNTTLNPRNGSSGIKRGASLKATRSHPTTKIISTVPCRRSAPVQETAIITTTATITAAVKAAGAADFSARS